MIIKGFNISKFSFDAGLMDPDSNYEILKDNILSKDVTYDKNSEDKTFAISVKT